MVRHSRTKGETTWQATSKAFWQTTEGHRREQMQWQVEEGSPEGESCFLCFFCNKVFGIKTVNLRQLVFSDEEKP